MTDKSWSPKIVQVWVEEGLDWESDADNPKAHIVQKPAVLVEDLPRLLREYKKFVKRAEISFCSCGACPCCDNYELKFLCLRGLLEKEAVKKE